MYTVFQTARDAYNFICKPGFLLRSSSGPEYFIVQVNVWSEVMLQPLVPVRLLSCAEGSVCSLENDFKSAQLLASFWVVPCTQAQPFLPKELLTMNPRGLFLAISFYGSPLNFWLFCSFLVATSIKELPNPLNCSPPDLHCFKKHP